MSLRNEHGQFVRLKIETRIDYLHPAAKDAYVLGRIKKRLVRINFRGCRFVGLQPCAKQICGRRFILLLARCLLRFLLRRGGGSLRSSCSGDLALQAPCRADCNKKHQHQQLFHSFSSGLAVRCDLLLITIFTFPINRPVLVFVSNCTESPTMLKSAR